MGFQSRDAQQKHPPFFSYAPLHPPPAPPPPLFDPSRQAAQPLRPPTCISLWRPERDLSAAWPFVPRLSLLPRPRPPPVPAPPPPCPSSAAATTPPARSTRTGASSSTSATRTHIVTPHYGKRTLLAQFTTPPRARLRNCWHDTVTQRRRLGASFGTVPWRVRRLLPRRIVHWVLAHCITTRRIRRPVPPPCCALCVPPFDPFSKPVRVACPQEPLLRRGVCVSPIPPRPEIAIAPRVGSTDHTTSLFCAVPYSPQPPGLERVEHNRRPRRPRAQEAGGAVHGLWHPVLPDAHGLPDQQFDPGVEHVGLHGPVEGGDPTAAQDQQL